ncbi:hypothetical protein L910_0150 [Vibrio fluvialis PG41]|uniref:Uncharacterized protein n=1 Tax=Vibrio fluvialis PG41 TaxID=1336752 RepID=S7JLK3_VIBFL|nr:hypothetical protein L910_0150 [Vibrio fluvialis PG41]
MMRKHKLNGLSVMWLLVIGGCSSTPVVPQCPQSPAPPAWMMSEPPNLPQTLNELISVSETNTN